MIAWMLYAAIVGGLVCVAARAAEWIGRARGWPVRWVWAGAILLTMSITSVASFRMMQPRATVTIVREVRPVGTSSAAPQNSIGLLSRFMDSARSAVEPLERGFTMVRGRTPRGIDGTAAMLVALLSLTVLAVMFVVERRFRAARRHWPVSAIAGERVRVSPNIGPVVVGLTQPEIVVPGWLLDRSDAEQRLVVAHEAEHVRAHDPLVLGGACVAVALMPWNPAAWYTLTRLRLAVELDCDARVIRRGASATSYGALLIDVAERALPLRLAALALADDSSHLHQRLLAMKAQTPRFAFARGTLAAALGTLALLAACEAKLPTQADVAQMDAASAERALVAAKATRDDSIAAYVVDGVPVSAAAARLLRGDTIESIAINRTKTGLDTIHFTIHFVTRRKDDATRDSAGLVEESTVLAEQAGRGGRGRVVMSPTTPTVSAMGFKSQPAVVLIDGVVVSYAQLNALNGKDIESIEVLKGAAGARENPGIPNADKGIIKVVTKAGAKPPQ